LCWYHNEDSIYRIEKRDYLKFVSLLGKIYSQGRFLANIPAKVKIFMPRGQKNDNRAGETPFILNNRREKSEPAEFYHDEEAI
jgi:hypothetical protein